MLRLAAGVAALSLVGSAQAAVAPNVGVANALKTTMQRLYKANGSDDLFTRVTCVASSTSTYRCKAYFTSKSSAVRGWFAVTAKGTSAGLGRWQATRVTCTSLKTGKLVAC